MKICLINTNIAWGGGEKWHFNQAMMLSKNGFDVSLIVYPESELHNKLKKTSVTLLPLKVNKYSFLNPITKRKVHNIFKSKRFKAIILNLPQDVKLFAQIAYTNSVSKIIYRRGMDHPIKPSFYNKRIYPKYLSHIIANSEKVKASVYANIPELKEKIEILYNGVDLHEIPPIKDVQDKLILGNLGRLVEQKGQHYLIQLAKDLNKKKVDFEIIIAGSGPLKQTLTDLIKKEKLETQIKLIGHTDASLFFKRIDFFIFPSLFEGLSNALLEAQKYRKPTFAFDVSSNSEIIKDFKNGFLFSINEISQMANEIVSLQKSPARQEKIRECSLQVLKEKFDLEKLNQKLIGLLNE